jgi:hypothetical protein
MIFRRARKRKTPHIQRVRKFLADDEEDGLMNLA